MSWKSYEVKIYYVYYIDVTNQNICCSAMQISELAMKSLYELVRRDLDTELATMAMVWSHRGLKRNSRDDGILSM